MSSGQKAWAEELDEEIYKERLDRLKAISPSTLLKCIEDLKVNFSVLERSMQALSRQDWNRIDKIKDILEELS